MVPMLVLVVLALLPQVDRSEKLNAPLDVVVTLGDVEDFRVTPDGLWAVYRAPEDSDTAGLYATRTNGSTDSILLSEPGQSVGAFDVSDVGNRTVFLSGANLFRLGSLGTRVQLNPPLVAGGAVLDFQLSPDGTRAVYRADQEVDGRVDLYSVNLVGTPVSVRLSRILGSVNGVLEYTLAANGVRVVFLADLVLSGRPELFSAPLDGSLADVRLCAGFVPGGSVLVGGFALSSDSTRVAFKADALVNDKVELFSAPLDGSGGPVRLSAVLPAYGNVTTFQIAMTGGRVAYMADGNVDNVSELYSAPLDASAPAVQLNQAEAPVIQFALSPSGANAAFTTRHCGGNSNLLWSVPLDGSQPPLSIGNHPTFSRCLSGLSVTPDSTGVLYLVSFGGTNELFRVALDGSSLPIEIEAPPAASVHDYRLTSDEQSLVLVIDNGTRRLAIAPLDGSAPAQPLFALPFFSAGQDGDFALVGPSAFFRADLERRGVLELYAAPLDASLAPLRLNEDLIQTPTTTDVTSIAPSPNGNGAAYTTGLGAFSVEFGAGLVHRALMTSDSLFPLGYGSMKVTADSTRLFWTGPGAGQHLFSAPFDASAPTVQVSSGSFANGFGATGAQFSPDGSRFLFSYGTYFGPGSIYTAPTTLVTPPVFLSGPSLLFRKYTSDMNLLVYGLLPYNEFYPLPNSIFVAPADAGAPAVELAPLMVTWPQRCLAGDLTADDSRVVYVRDDEEEFKYELYSVTLDTGAVPLKLSGTLAPGRRVANALALTPDGTRAVFVADRDVDEAYELYVVPVDGSAAPLELSGTLVSGGDVYLGSFGPQPIWVTPDSSRALYVADAVVDDRFDLYSVPLDGSEAPTLLAAAQIAGGDVELDAKAFQFTPDGQRIVFRGDLKTDGRRELFSVPVAGGTLLRVSGGLVANGNVELPFVLLDSREVLYRADAVANERFELWLAPVDRTGRPERRSFLAIPNGSVESDFQVDAEQEHVYYRADAEVNDRVEFFRFPLHPTPPVRAR